MISHWTKILHYKVEFVFLLKVQFCDTVQVSFKIRVYVLDRVCVGSWVTLSVTAFDKVFQLFFSGRCQVNFGIGSITGLDLGLRSVFAVNLRTRVRLHVTFRPELLMRF